MIAVESESLRRCSSSSKSETVVASSTLPNRVVAPVKCKNASASMVLPELPWEAIAMLRIFSVVYSFIGKPFLGMYIQTAFDFKVYRLACQTNTYRLLANLICLNWTGNID